MATFVSELWDAAAQPLNDEMFGGEVTYQRKGAAPITLTAIAESINYGGLDNEGMTTTATGRNYTFAVGDIPGEPMPGDRIMETIGGVPCAHEVMPLPGSKRAARLLNGAKRWLVHTERVQ